MRQPEIYNTQETCDYPRANIQVHIPSSPIRHAREPRYQEGAVSRSPCHGETNLRKIKGHSGNRDSVYPLDPGIPMYERHVRSDTKDTKRRGSTDLWNLHLDLLALRGDTFNVNIVVCRIVLLRVSECIFFYKHPSNDQRNDAAGEEAPADDTPGHVVPRCILGLPHERSDGIPDAIGNQKDGVGCDSFGMTCGDRNDPGEGQDEPGQTNTEGPNRTQKSYSVSPRQEGDEETSHNIGDSTKGGNVSAGVRDAGRELKIPSVWGCDDECQRTNLDPDKYGDDFNHAVDTSK